MAAGGYRTFVAGEVLDENDINDYLMQGILVFGGTAARGSSIAAPVEGQFAFLTDTDTLTYHDGSSWVEYQAGFFPATVGTSTGAVTGSFTDGNGFEWDYYEFTGNGSIVIDQAGYADVLVVGGGGGGSKDPLNVVCQGGGGAGAVRYGLQYLTAGTATVTIGAGGTGNATQSPYKANNGTDSTLGSFVVAGGGQGGAALTTSVSNHVEAGVDYGGGAGGVAINTSSTNNAAGGGAGSGSAGLSLNYKGTAVTYGVGGSSATGGANTGSGGLWSGGNGADGVVIVKVLK